MRTHIESDTTLDRPIFLTGCCKSGTTMLGMQFLNHPEVGPKPEFLSVSDSRQAMTDSLLVDEQFDVIAHEMETKDVWDRFFPMSGVELRIGKELRLTENPLSSDQTQEFITAVASQLREPRFFAKHPANCFRAHVLREIFPDAKIIAIHRDGRDVISSWGRKADRWQRYGGYATAIDLFARKWNETVEHIEAIRDELEIKVVQYESLVNAPAKVLQELFEWCELPISQAQLDEVRLRSDVGLWQERIPKMYHRRVEKLTAKNRRQLGYS